MKTALEKCGVTNQIVNKLKQEGLFVPKKIQVAKKILKSPSEFWIYYTGDKFTPSLSKKERLDYISKPEKFYIDLLRGVKFFVKVNGILYNAFKNAKKNLRKEELVAALLAIQRIWHASIDYNYFKLDRHLEYHAYRESPVGYYWSRLNKLCLSAAVNSKVKDKDIWAKEKLLKMLSGYQIVEKSAKLRKESKEAYLKVRGNLKSKNQIKELDKSIKAFKIFSNAQEDEAKIFNSTITNNKISAVEFILVLWGYFLKVLQINSYTIKPKYFKKLMNLRKAEDLPSRAIGLRMLSYKGEIFFVPKVQKLYFEELRRWI